MLKAVSRCFIRLIRFIRLTFEARLDFEKYKILRVRDRVYMERMLPPWENQEPGLFKKYGINHLIEK